jgi:hypothetical protein
MRVDDTCSRTVLTVLKFPDIPTREKTVIVEFVEDGERRVVTREKKWKLRSRADDEEVDFDSVKEGHKVSAYWSPNRAYYDAAVINVDRGSAYECHQKSVKRTLSLDVNVCICACVCVRFCLPI